MPVGVLILGALAVVLPVSLASLQDGGPHGFSEILYAYSSGTGNNGSAFAGFGAGTIYHNTMIGIAMLLGRYAMLIPMLAVAGALAVKTISPPSAGTFPTHTPLFVVLLIAVVLIIGGLTFFPALALGPIAEHFALLAGQTF
jgi:K+-transporting ATPase ATPase A chain